MANLFKVFFVLIFLGANPCHAAWYEGGDLHGATGLEWQKASRHDKVATCADFVVGMNQKGALKPEISKSINSIDDYKPYAEELVKQLDSAFVMEPNPKKNHKLYVNQTVSSTAVMLMIYMGWVAQ